MEQADFARLATTDSESWWFVAKQDLAVDALETLGVRGPVLDVGCGTGGNLRALARGGFRPLIGLDLEAVALQHLRAAVCDAAVVRARAEALPVRSGAAGAVVSMDVIEHLADDVEGLRAYAGTLGPGGVVVIVVPAYEWAWTAKDDRLGHRRRYTRRRLRSALERAGFDVVRVTHFHVWLAPIALLATQTPLRRLPGSARNEAGTSGARIDRVLRLLGRIERRAIRRTDLPIGLSILATAVVADR